METRVVIPTCARLSPLRAERVHGYLASRGWEGAEKSLVRGLGGKAPVTGDPGRQNLNRRVEVRSAGKEPR